MISPALQSAYCAINAVSSFTTARADLLTIFNDATDALISGTPPTIPSTSNPGVGLLQSLLMNVWLEYLSFSGAFFTVTGMTNKTTLTLNKAEIALYIQNTLDVSGANTLADVK